MKQRPAVKLPDILAWIRESGAAWPACLSIFSGILGQFFLYVMKNIPVGLVLFIIAAAALAAAGRQSTKNSSDKNDFFPSVFTLSRKNEMIFIILIMLLGAFMRLYQLDTIPAGCYADEGSAGLIAHDALNGKVMPLFNDPHAPASAALLTYSDLAAVFKFFGAGITQIRLASAIYGILAVPAFYFLIRFLAGPVPAIAGSFILAVMRWHINFSRIGFHAAFAVLVIILAVYFTLRAYYGKKTFDFALLGFMLSFSVSTYQAAQLFPFVMLINAVYVLFHDREFFTVNLRKLIIFAVVAAVVSIPFFNYAANNPGSFMARTAQVYIFNNSMGGAGSKAALLLENIKDSLLMFNYRGDINSRHNLPGQPELDFSTGIFAAVGFGYALTRIFQPVYFFFISGFFILMSAGFFSIAAPHSLRTILAIPFVIFFMLVFIGKFIAAFKPGVKAPAAIIALMLLASGVENFDIYFNRQAKDPRCWEAFSTQEYSAAQAAKKAMSQGWRVAAAPCYIRNPAFRFALYGTAGCDTFDLSSFIPARPPDNTNLMYLLPMEYIPMTDYLKDLYPGGTVINFQNKYDGSDIFFCFALPATAIRDLKRDLSKNGVNMTCFDGRGFTGNSMKKTMPCVLFSGLDDFQFKTVSVLWSAKLAAPLTGEYGFDLRSHGYSCVYIDGNPAVCNQSRPGSCDLDVNKGSMFMKKGAHEFEVRYETNDTPSYKQGCTGLWLFWKKPGDKIGSTIPGTMLFPSK